MLQISLNSPPSGPSLHHQSLYGGKRERRRNSVSCDLHISQEVCTSGWLPLLPPPAPPSSPPTSFLPPFLPLSYPPPPRPPPRPCPPSLYPGLGEGGRAPSTASPGGKDQSFSSFNALTNTSLQVLVQVWGEPEVLISSKPRAPAVAV